MKKILYILSVVIFSTMLTGCEDWLDVNTSKDAPVTVVCEEVMPSLLYFATQGVYDFTEYATYLSQPFLYGKDDVVALPPVVNAWLR